MCDVTMTVTDQMPSRCDGRFVVIGDDSIGQQPIRRSVHEHQRRTLLSLRLQVALIFSNGVQDQSIDPSTGEGIDHDPLAVRIVVRAGGYHRRVTTLGHGLDSTVN
jgi:hypothetical protein